MESRIIPFSHTWLQLSDKEKLEKLFVDSDASREFKEKFAASRFGKKVLGFKPDFSFHEMTGKDAESTVSKVHGIPTTIIKDTVKAAAETKESAGQVVEFLRALFPGLWRQAELEEAMGLEPDEELVV